MEDAGSYLGKTYTMTGKAALLQLEAAICEGISTPANWPVPKTTHLSGRQVEYTTAQDLSFVTGLATAGLRTAAFLPIDDFTRSFHQIRELARLHVPAVLYCLTRGTSAHSSIPFSTLLENEYPVWYAADAQEAIELSVFVRQCAEQSLRPGIIFLSREIEKAEADIQFPEAKSILDQLGTADDIISTPSTAQEFIFGPTRRRIPNWSHVDLRTITNGPKNVQAYAQELAAQKQFFDRDTKDSAGIITPFDHYQVRDADYVLIYWGLSPNEVAVAVDRYRSENRKKVGAIRIRQFSPFPDQELRTLLKGKKGITILEPYTTLSGQRLLSKGVVANLETVLTKRNPVVCTGTYGASYQTNNLEAVFHNMTKKGLGKSPFFTGLSFSRRESSFPQHEVLLQSIKRNFPEVSTWTIDSERIAQPPKPIRWRTPWQLRLENGQRPPFADSTHFYHNTAALYAQGALEEIVADPMKAVPVTPAGSGSMAPPQREQQSLPLFSPEHCTGCGDCLVYCPHAALPALALPVESLLRAGMQQAKQAGHTLRLLTPLLKSLSITAGKVIQANEIPINSFADFLPQAFEEVSKQKGLDANKKAAVFTEIEILIETLAGLPTAVTEPLFHNIEQHDPGQGVLFSLALDLQSCTACGICAAVCPTEALQMTEDQEHAEAQANKAIEIWEQLPDTSPEIISRLHRDPEYDSLAAILLSRYNYQSMSGPGHKAGTGNKTVLHLVTAMAESVQQPRFASYCQTVDSLITDLSENIRNTLSEALPSEDSLGLIAAISKADGESLPLDEIISTLGKVEHLKLLDTAALQRKIQLINDLKDLNWTLKKGPTGAGRAHYGLNIYLNDPNTLGAFPFHPFHVPVLVRSDLGIGVSIGQIKAYVRHSLDNIRLLRRAELEKKNKYRPQVNAKEIANLNWAQLSDTEKSWVPPVIVVCKLQELPADMISQLPELFALDLPVKIVILDEASPGTIPELRRDLANRQSLLDISRACQTPALAGSLYDRKLLFDSFIRQFRSNTPMLLLLYSPNASLHQNAQVSPAKLTKLAVDSRAFPLYQFDPEAGTALLAEGTTLEGNPAARDEWFSTTLTTKESEEDKSETITLHYAHWLKSLKAWKEEFIETSEAKDQHISVDQYLNLSPEEQASKVPVVYQYSENTGITCYEVSEQVVDACRLTLHSWYLLREKAGTLSPHPVKLWQEAQVLVKAEYEQQIEKLKQEFAQREAQIARETMNKARHTLREKLVALALKAKANKEKTEQT